MRFSPLLLSLVVVSACEANVEPQEDVDTESAAATASGLNGQMLLTPCLVDTAQTVCATVRGVCPQNPTDRALNGVLTTDKTLTLGGPVGKPFTITLHVQGEVEAKAYPGGVDQNSTKMSPVADGFTTGGVPTAADFYNSYLIRVTNPGSTTHTDYFLNSLIPPGVSNHTTYGVDYSAKIKAQGGATIRLVAADPNCSTIKNCGPSGDQTTCTPMVISHIEPAARALNPTFNFDTPYNGQWLVMTVTRVSSP